MYSEAVMRDISILVYIEVVQQVRLCSNVQVLHEYFGLDEILVLALIILFFSVLNS